MTDYQNLYTGITKAAWGYFFIYFNINIGTVNILPSFIGYLLFLSAINNLKDEERELSLLRTLGVILTVWHGAEWIVNWFGIDPNGALQFIDIIISFVNLYFNFQLITNLASIATKYQTEGSGLDAELLMYRTLQTVMLTVITIIYLLYPTLFEIWQLVTIAVGLVYVIAGFCLMRALFSLRKCLPTS